MLFETFHGSDLRVVFEEARRALGDDVVIVRSNVDRRGARTQVEVVAAAADSLATLTQRLTPPPPVLPRATGGRGRSGPFVLALVGPTGSGKTTALARLALSPVAFGGKSVGVLSLDTYRVAAIEQLQQYAEIGRLALEVAYDAREIPGAMRRLERCDVVLIDTPGRSPRARDVNEHWHTLLRGAAPDETHLVIPATQRPDLLGAVVEQFAACHPTHLLLTKTDEVTHDTMIADVAARIAYPMRWLCDGQGVPADVRPARDRILAALGLPTHARRARAA